MSQASLNDGEQRESIQGFVPGYAQEDIELFLVAGTR